MVKEYEDTKQCWEKDITDEQLNDWLDIKLQDYSFRESLKDEYDEEIRDYLEGN